MTTKFYSNGTQVAIGPNGESVPLARGWYLFSDVDGSIARYEAGGGMNGFWSSLGAGFKKVGSWIGNNFGTIATAGLTIFGIHQAGNLQQQQAQAAADAAAQQAAQAQQISGQSGGLDMNGILPYALLGIGAFLLLRK